MYNHDFIRFLSVDSLTKSYPWYTPYQFAGNKPIIAVDLDGLEEKVVINKIAIINGVLKVIDKTELTAENSYHKRFGNFTDYANQEQYGSRGTLVVNQFLDPVELTNGNKLNRYEYLELSTWDKVKNAFSITSGEGGTQKGGVSYTDGGEGGAMETKDHALSGNVKIVDIGSLLIYWNYSKRDITTKSSSIRDIMDPEVMADAADLIGDIGDLTKDNGASPSDQELGPKRKAVDSSCIDCSKLPHDSFRYIRKDAKGLTIDTIDPKKK